MPGIFFAFTVKDKDDRPLSERGFTEVEPVSPYANQSGQNERNIPIGKGGKDPIIEYPALQKKINKK